MNEQTIDRYSHAVRSHGGFIAVSAISSCTGIEIDGEGIGFQVSEDNGARVHTYKCHSQRTYARTHARTQWID